MIHIARKSSIAAKKKRSRLKTLVFAPFTCNPMGESSRVKVFAMRTTSSRDLAKMWKNHETLSMPQAGRGFAT